MSINILLADDSITIQKVVGIIFGGEDYTLTVVDNGKAAVEKARELNPDVLLIDALMPGMSGYEVCEAVRATPSLATKPILLLTGSFEPFDETKAKNCGADDFLAKPFESQQIVTKVKELFDLGASRAGNPEQVAAPAFAEFEVEPAAVPFAEEPAAANDIWGAFTAPEETSSASETLAGDEDIYAMVSEDPEAGNIAASPESEDSGSQWIPVEENTFEFQEEAAAAPDAPAFFEPEPVPEENTFEIEIPASSVEPAALTEKAEPVALNEPEEPTVETQVSAPAAVISTEPAVQTAMTEEQLRVALAGASKEVIERIVWEVVPDLAETMIKEAIRKIKEGM